MQIIIKIYKYEIWLNFKVDIDSFVVCFVQGWDIMIIYNHYTYEKNNHTMTLNQANAAIICHVLRGIEALVNCLSLTFAFVFSQHRYESYDKWCFVCHNCLKNCFVRCIASRNVCKIQRVHREL